MKLKLLIALSLLAAGTIPAHATPLAVPLVEGPDVPPVTVPSAVIRIFDGERYDGCKGKVVAAREVAIPAGAYDRAIVDFTAVPDGDPWDRLFRISIGGVDVLRGTTPRTSFHLRKDITEYLTLLPAGGSATVSLELGTYVGEQVGSVSIELYSDEPTAALVRAPAREVVPVFDGASLTGNNKFVARDVTFAPTAPAKAIVDLTLTNHGDEEAQFVNRIFHVLIDGKEVATARAMPYVYAIAGTGGANANTACAGPGTSSTGDAVHPVAWWTAQQAADVAGVHLGVGEIPPYRAELEAADLALLAGARRVQVVQQGGRAVWITSLALLLS